MILSTIRDEIATQLDTISGLRVYAWPADNPAIPAGIVTVPNVDFDTTYGRGVDRAEVAVHIIVGRASERTAHDELDPYCDGAGAQSIKTVLEAGSYTTIKSLRVARVETNTISIAGVDYLGAVFTVEIYGSGN